MLRKIKKHIRNHNGLMMLLACIYNAVMFNQISRRGLSLDIRGAFLKKTTVKNKGRKNTLVTGEGCRLTRCSFRFFGDNNEIRIANDCELKDLEIWISDGGCVRIGKHTHITGKTHIACIEGKTVSIGERSLFSSNITFRTGDSHSILDSDGKRINYSQDINIGEHVWIGQNVTVLKGSCISRDSIIGSGSLVTGKQFPEGVVIAGNPAKVVRENVNWCPELVKE